jgi:carbonic anhydrase
MEFKINDHTIIATYNTTKNGCTPPQMRIPGQGKAFDALQFHFHTGSDHALDGRFFGADMHLVHQEVGGSGRLSVLGFFFEPTDSDGIAKVRDLLDEWEAVAAATIIACQADGINIWSSQTPFGNQSAAVQQSGGRRVVESEQEHRTLPRGFNPYDLIPAGSSMYTYEGSLTTPPCTEIVFWNVIDTPVSVSVLEFIRIVNLVIDFANPETCTLDTVAAESGFTGRPVQAINGRKIERICPTGFVDPLAVPDCPEPTTQASETAATGTSGAACAASVVTAVLMLLTGIALV